MYPTTDKTIVYGSAIYTILRQERLINGASDEVNKNKNAACPLGVATLGKFVPVFIAIARLLNCVSVITPLSKALLTSLMYIVATKTLSLIADRKPFATKNNEGCVEGS